MLVGKKLYFFMTASFIFPCRISETKNIKLNVVSSTCLRNALWGFLTKNPKSYILKAQITNPKAIL